MILVLIGLLMVFSASAVMSSEQYSSPYVFLERQLVYAVVGVLALLLTLRMDYRRLRHPAVVYGALFLTILLLAVVFLFDRSHHTHRWIRLGAFSLQPSELAKPALILFLAFYLQSRLKRINEWRVLQPALLCIAFLAALVVFEPDLGTTIALLFIAAAMFFVAGLRLRYFLYALATGALPLYLLVFDVAYRRERIFSFLHPWSDPQGRSFQIVQSLIAVGSGGLSGAGLMDGRQKLFFLPEPHTDFIFAVIGEELGLVGSFIVLALFIVFLVRGLRVARLAPDPFGRLLAVGITAMVVIQALINFSVVIGLMPTKGIPLPFISYGGSSLLVTLAAAGVLLNISQRAD
jgi:cell division protein FtsW